MSKRWLTPAEMHAWRNFVETTNRLMPALEADLAPFDLTMGDYQVLVHLSESADHQMRMCDLAAALQLSPSGLTRRLDGLVRSGLVERRASPADRRVAYAVLTDAGMRRLESAAPDHVASVRRHFIDELSPAELVAIAEGFRRIRGHLDSPA